jgi:multicomponent Na+:H+ antiporter subunit B
VSERTDSGERTRPRRPYTESTVIMTTVRLVAPFVLTFGLFVMFHGTSSAGGGFQGGTIVAATIIMLAFAFGIESARRWFVNRVVVGLLVGGLGLFAAIGLGPIALGGQFLEYGLYAIPDAAKYGIEGVELGIGAIVAGVISGLFFAIAHGFEYREGRQ